MNPRAAVNDLLPFQGSPFGQLGYFSKLPYLHFRFQKPFVSILPNSSELIYYLFKICPLSGEGGIRTHAPLRTNGFQDRLVMTTSIPLQVSALTSAQAIYYQFSPDLSTTIFKFFYFFLKSVFSGFFTGSSRHGSFRSR